MGCDIHMILQIKQKEGWIYLDKVELPRHYELFSLLAQVRGENSKGFEPKGLPPNFPKDYNQCLYLGEHSFSYLTLKDLKKKKFVTELQRLGYDSVIPKYYDDLTSNDKIRVVFGFDS